MRVARRRALSFVLGGFSPTSNRLQSRVVPCRGRVILAAVKRIVLGVTGSIAAYKAADIASHLAKEGHRVSVVMTSDAQEFITPLTLQTLSKQPVTGDLYDEKDSWRPGHIELADEADLMLIAPATAHTIAQIALGLAGDTLTAIALATRAPCSSLPR